CRRGRRMARAIARACSRNAAARLTASGRRDARRLRADKTRCTSWLNGPSSGAPPLLLGLVGDHAHVDDPAAVEHVEHLDDPAVGHLPVSLEEHRVVAPRLGLGLDLVDQVLDLDRSRAQEDLAVAVDRQDERVLHAHGQRSSLGAAIMKMMSRTSITSTRGVTLMSAITGSSSPLPLPRVNAMVVLYKS